MRFEYNLAACKLTRTTGPLLVGVVYFCLTRDRLTVCNLSRTNVCLNLEFRRQAINTDVHVKFAHTCDDGLARSFGRLNAEAWIISRQTIERNARLFLVSFGLWFNRDFDTWIREFHAL